jgi:putative ABC transport system ATP-binding protein
MDTASPPLRHSESHIAESAVVTRHLNYAFDTGAARKQVLNGINFVLERGEFVILTGPSGAGKTTLMTLVGALRAPQTGSLKVFDTELAGLSAAGQREIRRKIGFIFQDHNLFEALTAFQTLSLAMKLCDDRVTKVAAQAKASGLLAALGMAEHLHNKPRTLSTGQKQRVAIARALINDPPIILADEPTAALDVNTARVVIDVLRQRVAAGASVLMVTHDNRAFPAADRIVNMIDGRIASEA